MIRHPPRRHLDQPAARVRGHAVVGPLGGGSEERLLHGVLGAREVAEPADDGPEHLRRELAELVIEMIGSRSKLVQLPLPSDDPSQRRPDISLAKRELDWSPQVELRAGLEQTIAYFRRLAN